MDKSEWVKITEFDKGDEDRKASHPLEEWDEVKDMRIFLDQLEENYKDNYDELRIVYKWKSHGFGAQSNWYELQGRYTDPKKIVLYGNISKQQRR